LTNRVRSGWRQLSDRLHVLGAKPPGRGQRPRRRGETRQSVHDPQQGAGGAAAPERRLVRPRVPVFRRAGKPSSPQTTHWCEQRGNLGRPRSRGCMIQRVARSRQNRVRVTHDATGCPATWWPSGKAAACRKASWPSPSAARRKPPCGGKRRASRAWTRATSPLAPTSCGAAAAISGRRTG
jgi:hypothetical protein